MAFSFIVKRTVPPEPPFVPSGTPYAWYSADSLSLSNNDPVTTWQDLSGNGYDLSGGAAPTFQTNIQNGKAAVYFNNDYLVYDWPDMTQPNTYFIVCKLADTTNGVIFSGLATGSRNHLYVESGLYKLYAGAIYNGPSADTDTHILTARFNGANSFFKVDGVYSATANASTQVMSGMTLGASYDTNQRKTMHVMEFLVYNGAEATLDNEAGLATKWGIII